MVADGEAHLFVDVRLDELGRPVAVVAANEPGGRDVVEQAGEDDLLVYAVLLGEPRALHQVLGGTEAELEEVEQRRLVRHPRQARIVAHQVPLALVRETRGSRADPQAARKVVRKACSLVGSAARGASARAVASAIW